MHFRTIWNNADLLYAKIVWSLQNQTFDHLSQASERLLTIDSNRERARITRGIVHYYLKEYEKAQEILEQCVREFGESGAALTNLSKTYFDQGKKELALKTLRHSLHVDPNQNAALMWYAKLGEEQAGRHGIIRAFEEIAEEPGSWRALLWLARERLNDGKRGDALELYRKALLMGYDSDALMMIVGDLGKGGFPEDGIALIESKYDPSNHDGRIGLNLLQCYLDLRRPSDGNKLISRMLKCPHDAVASQLSWYFQEFAKLTSNPVDVGALTPYPDEVEAAKRSPNAHVYRVVDYAGPAGAVPKEAVVGMWKVDAQGKIVGEFIRNPYYDPKQWPPHSMRMP